MKYLILLLFLTPCLIQAQTLDVSKVEVVNDSTVAIVHPDTMYFLIETGTKAREGKSSIQLARATLIVVKGGQTYADLTSGIRTQRQVADWLKAQRDGWIEGDIKRSQAVVKQYQELKQAINEILQPK